MRSKQLDLAKYNTDKITNRYLEQYDTVLEPWVDKEIKLLEIGVYKGGSLNLWHDYFSKGTIIGIDIFTPDKITVTERIKFYKGSQADRAFLTDVSEKNAPDGFDIIIDDASHIGELSRMTFWHLFENHLKPGGLYVMEDWGTGYWPDYPDGKKYNVKQPFLSELWKKVLLLNRAKLIYKFPFRVPIRSHHYGMVGFIKELVDEQGAHDHTRISASEVPARQSKFESLLIRPSIVFVRKACQ